MIFWLLGRAIAGCTNRRGTSDSGKLISGPKRGVRLFLHGTDSLRCSTRRRRGSSNCGSWRRCRIVYLEVGDTLRRGSGKCTHLHRWHGCCGNSLLRISRRKCLASLPAHEYRYPAFTPILLVLLRLLPVPRLAIVLRLFACTCVTLIAMEVSSRTGPFKQRR